MSAQIIQGDCIEAMHEMPDSTIDALVCDPPAGISFMSRSWDGDKGGMEQWVDWLAEALAEARRLTKPGAHALVWALPRTSHWTGLALEQAGWEVRDCITHHFGTGFPKSKDLGDGLGTALKPATEFWFLARKPFDGSTTANFLKHGTSALNIDATRIGTTKDVPASPRRAVQGAAYGDLSNDPGDGGGFDPNLGRWPANLCLSHAEDCEQVGECVEGCLVREMGEQARFFYCAKPSKKEKNAGLNQPNDHPTVKGIELMRWLVRLVTPSKGTVFDPFMGSGTTGCAAVLEGLDFIGIEREAEYVEIAKARIEHWQKQASNDLFTLFDA